MTNRALHRWHVWVLLFLVLLLTIDVGARTSENGDKVAPTGFVRWLFLFAEVNYLESDRILIGAGQSGTDFYTVELDHQAIADLGAARITPATVNGAVNELLTMDFAADRHLYLAQAAGEAVRTDHKGGPATPTGVLANRRWRAMTAHADGRIHAYTPDEPNPGLYEIELETAAATRLPSTLPFHALARSPDGDLFGLSGSELYEIGLDPYLEDRVGTLDRQVAAMDFAYVDDRYGLVGVENRIESEGRRVPTFVRIDFEFATTSEIADAQPFGDVGGLDGLVHTIASIPSDWDGPAWKQGELPAGAAEMAQRFTDYYHHMSCGHHRVEVLYYPRMVRTPRGSHTDLLNEVGRTIVNSAIETNQGMRQLDLFDNWDLTPSAGQERYPGKNDRVDVVHVLWRNYHPNAGRREFQTGGGKTSTNVHTPSSWSPITHIEGMTRSQAPHAQSVGIVYHEYLHLLFGDNSFHTGAGAGNHTFMAPTGSYSMTAEHASSSNVACGWDRHRLGWKFAHRNHLISAIDPSTGGEVETDLSIETHPAGGTFLLSDFLTRGDALRIRLPHVLTRKVPTELGWRPGTDYEAGDFVTPRDREFLDGPGDARVYRALTGGTSGSSEPAWTSGIGQGIVDAGVVWEFVMADFGQLPAWEPETGYAVGQYAKFATFPLDPWVGVYFQPHRSVAAGDIILMAAPGEETKLWRALTAGELSGGDPFDPKNPLEPEWEEVYSVKSHPPRWKADRSYVEGDYVLASVGAQHRLFRCSSSDTSGGAEPLWPAVMGETVADAGATWEFVWVAPSPHQWPHSQWLLRVAQAGTSGATEPDWTSIGIEPLADGGAAWDIVGLRPSAPPGQPVAPAQYLWIENRRLEVAEFDTNGGGAAEKWTPGIYAYLQIDRDDKSSFNGHGSYLYPLGAEGNHDFYWELDRVVTRGIWGQDVLPYSRSRSIPNPFTGCSEIYWQVDSDSIDYESPGNNRPAYLPLGNGVLIEGDLRRVTEGHVAWQASTDYQIDDTVVPTKVNEFPWLYRATTAGTSGTTEPVWGANSVTDGAVTWEKGKELPMLARVLTENLGTPEERRPQWGDGEDAFSFANGNTKLGLGTNPAPVPVYTHRSDGGFGSAPSADYDFDFSGKLTGLDLCPFETRTIWLNGLSVEILEENVAGTGAARVRVRWDDYRVDNDARWCGSIELRNDDKDPFARQARVILGAGRNLHLDRGLSPTQYYAWPDAETFTPGPAGSIYPAGAAAETERHFTEPSVLKVRRGSRLHLEPGATIWLRNGSTLEVEAGAEIVLEGNANLAERIREVGGTLVNHGEIAVLGDVDNSGAANMTDLFRMLAVRNQPVAQIADRTFAHRADLDGDGVITVLDIRKLVLLSHFER